MATKKPLTIYDNYISNLKSFDSLQTDISGNSETASKLKSPVTITFTGDFLANTTFDGSENVTISGSVPKLSEKVNSEDLSNIAFTGSFSDISDKPSTISGYGITDSYTKSEVDSELSGKLGISEKATSASVADSVSWEGVSGKPETYPPSTHNHEISQINNLQSVLDSKQPVGDYVTESEFQSSLENKLDVDAKASSSYFSDVANSVSWSVVSDKPIIPTKISQLENDSGYLYSVSWDIIESKPSTISGYGITDAYSKIEIDSSLSNYVLKNVNISSGTHTKITYDSKGLVLSGESLQSSDIPSLDASKITSGVFDIERLPKSAIERLVIVSDDVGRFNLTTSDVQNGDTVKVNSTSKMYFVIDDSNLNTESGYCEYSAGTAASVPWSGITNKPSTISGYNITDVYTKSDVDGKIASIPEQVNADWNSSSGKSQILNKPSTLSGYGITDAYTKSEIDSKIESSDVLPPQEGNSGKFLTTDGENVSWGSIQSSMPIGAIYVQFSGQSDPSTLFGGEWENVSSTYAGLFFRAEGGSAAAFGGSQTSGAPNIVGGFSSYWHNSASGAFYQSAAGQLGRGGGDYNNAALGFEASRSNATYGAADEIRPSNSTIRIWKRTA